VFSLKFNLGSVNESFGDNLTLVIANIIGIDQSRVEIRTDFSGKLGSPPNVLPGTTSGGYITSSGIPRSL
jgi:hypothetical protein